MELAGTVIYVDDVPSVLEFYSRAFGIEARFVDLDVQLPDRRPSERYHYADLATKGGPLQLASHALGALLLPGYERPVDGRPAGVEIAFYTNDVQGAFDRAVAAGAAVVAPPKAAPWGQTLSYVRSVEGTIIGICSPPADAG